MNLEKFETIFNRLENGVLGLSEFELSCWLFALTFLEEVDGAIIAGATRIIAATRSGALKYVSAATRQPAE